MSEEHRPTNDNGVDEDDVATSPQPQSEVTPESMDHLQGQSDTTVSSSLTTANSSFADRMTKMEFVLDEPTSVPDSPTQISLAENRSTVDDVIYKLRNLTDSEIELRTGASFFSSSPPDSETEREVEFSGATEFTSDVTPSLTHQEGEAEHQREFTATQSQTVWTSLNTPGSSLTEVQKEIPKGLKAQLLEIPSDAGDERKQKTKSGESDIENLTDQSDVDYRTQLMISSTNATICEYCHQIRLPFPDPAELDFKGPEEVLMNRDENPDLEEIPSEHPGFYLTELEINEAKAKLAKRIKISEVTMYMTSIEIGDKIVFTHSKTISYKLSSEYCSKQGWTLRPRIAVHSAYEDLSLYVPSAQSYKELKRRLEIVEKYYPNGQKFLTRFPDGTGNVFYPSGNIAIVISAFHQTQLVYIILQDMAWNAKFLGIFRSNGQGTCYLPNGLIWINVTPLCGSYFTEQGLTKKQWQWRDYYHHVHAPPYQSISLKLNSYINIRVISRDQIYTTFETKKRNVRFNMGAKLVLRDLEHFHAMSKVTREEKYLNKVNQKIHKILEQIQHL